MSTVSIMPLGKKIKVKRETKLKIASQLATADNLKTAGLILGEVGRSGILILDIDTVIRVDGFSGAIAAKSYPGVKMSVFPEGGKMGQLYVSLDDLDGLTWEIVEEAVKPTSLPIKRLDINLLANRSDGSHCWHSAFAESYDTRLPVLKTINPLVLSEEEMKFRRFSKIDTSDAGTAVVKIEKSATNYTLQWATEYHFKTLINPTTGLLSAKFEYLSISLNIKEGWNYSNGEWHTLLTEARQGDESYESIIKKYLKEKHNL